MSDDALEQTRRSWNHATRNHNAHKGDRAALLAAGLELLYPEELDLLGDLEGVDLVHLQCNAGQDTLCLARRGATATGVDFADEAVTFARELSTGSGIPATFVQAEVQSWMEQTDQRFDVAFTSYGTTGWLRDIARWGRGVHRILRPGGRLVYVEFHPVSWSVAPEPPFGLTGDDYFAEEPFLEPVGDYVAESIDGKGLGAIELGETTENTIPATSWQHGMAQVLQAVIDAGLALERIEEWPYSNGYRAKSGLVLVGDRRFGWPEGTARIPLMYGLSARRPRTRG